VAIHPLAVIPPTIEDRSTDQGEGKGIKMRQARLTLILQRNYMCIIPERRCGGDNSVWLSVGLQPRAAHKGQSHTRVRVSQGLSASNLSLHYIGPCLFLVLFQMPWSKIPVLHRPYNTVKSSNVEDTREKYHFTVWASFSNICFTVAHENRTIFGYPNVRSRWLSSQAFVFGSDGYPEPTFLLHISASLMSIVSSNIHPSMHSSRVTLAATLAAPTIVNLESALAATVNEIPGKREER